MSVLSALLARDRVVPPQKIDEAIQRQVINGGDFETNLLEVGAIAEDTLVAYCAAVLECEPIGRDEVMAADPAALARMSGEVAEQHRLVPIRFDTGKLIAAAAAPLDANTRDLLKSTVGVPVEVRITTGFRIAWALAKYYGAELSPRMQRLASRIDRRPSGTMPAVNTLPSTPARPNLSTEAPNPRIRASVLEALSAALTEDHDAPAELPPAPSPPATTTAARAEMVTEPPADGEVWTPEQARSRVEGAKDRDGIVDVLLQFAGQRLAYVAAFLAHGDVAEGLDARGNGLDAESVRRLAVPLDAPGGFRSVKERGEPVLGSLETSPTDRVIKADLGRSDAAQVALLPIHIGGRVTLILWGDDGKRPLDVARIEQIAGICVEAARAFERLIVERKKRRTVADAASSAAAAIAAAGPPQMTTVDISRHLVQQRLRRSAPPPTNSTAPSEASPAARAAGLVSVRGSTVIPREEVETPTAPLDIDETTAGTRFARGGRVPIAVEVLGPLPTPTLALDSRASPVAVIPREERRDSAGPSDETLSLVATIVRTESLSDGNANLLLSAGDGALNAIFHYFPGPTRLDRTNTRTRVPPVSEIGPLLRLVVMFRQASGPHLVGQLESYDAERRYYATLCLSEVVFPPAIEPLVSRLFDTDYPTAIIAVEALKSYRRQPAFDAVARSLRLSVSDADGSADRRRVAANVLGEIRDAEAIPALLVALGDRDGALAGIAQRSLVVLARQDFRQDVDLWRAWWERSSAHHRIEWLIDGLLHSEPTIRHESSEELKKLTGQFFGYYFNLPRRERERAHQRYVEWWNREGRDRFASG